MERIAVFALSSIGNLVETKKRLLGFLWACVSKIGDPIACVQTESQPHNESSLATNSANRMCVECDLSFFTYAPPPLHGHHKEDVV